LRLKLASNGAGRVSASSDLLEVAWRLRAISRDDGSIDAAQVKLIGLDEIREAAGPRWPRMRERVRMGSIDILSRYTGPEDVIIPAGDGFLIVLAEGAPGQNQARCQRMRDALLAFYLGEEALASITPEVTSRSLSADGLADLLATEAHKEPAPARISSHAHGADVATVRLVAAHEHKVVAHMACPVRHERGVRRLAYNPDFILDGRHCEPHFVMLDFALAEHALSLAANVQGTVGVCVHASTMQQRRRREEYLTWAANTPVEVRRRMFVTIAEIERGTPLIAISEWCAALRGLFKRVGLDFHYTDQAIASVGGAGAWAAGFHLPIHSGAQKGPRANRTLDLIKFWSRTIHSQGMHLAVNGFQELDFLDRAAAAGVDIASSDMIWPFDVVDEEAAQHAAAAPAQ
jgi:hypothetical protein